jgi:DNA-binding PadR family transcriptional regulator
MTSLDQIYRFFHNPPPFYLNKELAVCYVLSVLLRGDSYGTELIGLLEHQHPGYRLSDTVLYSALKFLEDADAVTGYWKKVDGRGRPRRMYQITPQWRSQAEDLSHLWLEYATSEERVPVGTGV